MLPGLHIAAIKLVPQELHSVTEASSDDVRRNLRNSYVSSTNLSTYKAWHVWYPVVAVDEDAVAEYDVLSKFKAKHSDTSTSLHRCLLLSIIAK